MPVQDASKGALRLSQAQTAASGALCRYALRRKVRTFCLRVCPKSKEMRTKLFDWLKAQDGRQLRCRAIFARNHFANSSPIERSRNLGALDILVNNAAFQRTYANIEDIPEDELDATFRTNNYATFFLCQAAIPKMKPGGVILNTWSIQSFEPSESLIPYAATKAVMVSFTKSMAKAVANRGIRVNGVAPGPVWTPLIPSTMSEEKVKTFGENTAFKRPAMPVEQAAVFVFLASDVASYVTGEVYGATGGRTPY